MAHSLDRTIDNYILAHDIYVHDVHETIDSLRGLRLLQAGSAAIDALSHGAVLAWRWSEAVHDYVSSPVYKDYPLAAYGNKMIEAAHAIQDKRRQAPDPLQTS